MARRLMGLALLILTAGLLATLIYYMRVPGRMSWQTITLLFVVVIAGGSLTRYWTQRLINSHKAP